jgi:hypothetical protein
MATTDSVGEVAAVNFNWKIACPHIFDLPDRVTTSWLIGTFDTDGEVIFAMASTLPHQDFQPSTKHEPRVFPTSPSVSLLVTLCGG